MKLWPGPPWQQVMDIGQLYLLLAAIFRGINYLVTPPLPEAYNALSWLEPQGSLVMWGAGFITFGVLGLIGEVWYRKGTSESRWFLSWISFVWLMSGYLMVGLSTMIGIALRTPFYGFAAPAELLVLAVACAVCGQRRNQVIPRDY